jgi:hypothetical protein
MMNQLGLTYEDEFWLYKVLQELLERLVE